MVSTPGQIRDLVGYGREPPHAAWPNEARVALQFVINYEEGGERCQLNGDDVSETALVDSADAEPLVGVRDLEVESVFEYGSRAGFWRLLRLFDSRELPVSFFAVGKALERYPEAGRAMVESGHEVVNHGYRWFDYQHVPEAVEREHMLRSIEVQEQVTGARPLGWYTGRMSPNTRRLLVEEGGFVYDADSYADDLPYWDTSYARAHLVVPYTFDCNDMQFGRAAGFSSGEAFFNHLRDAFDQLYEEGERAPKMMSVGLHCRVVGRPARTRALARFLDHVQSFDRVWICRRIDIARHWHRTHPHPEAAPLPDTSA